jgi:acetolactate synthase-1/2/3 large subunit
MQFLMPSVADLLIAGLRQAGVPRVFGVPGGGSNLELLEAARVQGLPFVLAHQEWAACIMAAVTGELTGVPGAALSTLGPGVTASATGLAYARLDRAPLIYISDRHPEAAQIRSLRTSWPRTRSAASRWPATGTALRFS